MSYFPLFVTFSLLALDNFSFTYLSTSPVSFIAVFEAFKHVLCFWCLFSAFVLRSLFRFSFQKFFLRICCSLVILVFSFFRKFRILPSLYSVCFIIPFCTLLAFLFSRNCLCSFLSLALFFTLLYCFVVRLRSLFACKSHFFFAFC